MGIQSKFILSPEVPLVLLTMRPWVQLSVFSGELWRCWDALAGTP